MKDFSIPIMPVDDFNWETAKACVGAWSLYNFEDQRSKYTGQVFNSFFPLSGLTEEINYEYLEAIDMAKSDLEIKDCLADGMIYLLDFASRENVWMGDFHGVTRLPHNDIDNLLIRNIGKLHRLMLKMHQGIRGVENEFKEQLQMRVYQVALCLDAAAKKRFQEPISQVMLPTWNNVVCVRDWKSNPEGAADTNTL